MASTVSKNFDKKSSDGNVSCADKSAIKSEFVPNQ